LARGKRLAENASGEEKGEDDDDDDVGEDSPGEGEDDDDGRGGSEASERKGGGLKGERLCVHFEASQKRFSSRRADVEANCGVFFPLHSYSYPHFPFLARESPNPPTPPLACSRRRRRRSLLLPAGELEEGRKKS